MPNRKPSKESRAQSVASALVKVQLAQRLLEAPTKQSVRDAERALAQAEAELSLLLGAELEVNESENLSEQLPRNGKLFAN